MEALISFLPRTVLGISIYFVQREKDLEREITMELNVALITS